MDFYANIIKFLDPEDSSTDPEFVHLCDYLADKVRQVDAKEISIDQFSDEIHTDLASYGTFEICEGLRMAFWEYLSSLNE